MKKEHQIKFREGTISFAEQGKGNAVMLFHGFLESKENFSELSSVLSKKFRVITVDLPGHGKSDCFGYIHTMELLAQSAELLRMN
jgi:pimeloyl-ACP methyl ester carboxylesterase